MDIDAAELGKLKPHVQIQILLGCRMCSCGSYLSQRDAMQPRERSAGMTRCADWKTRYPIVTAEHRNPEGKSASTIWLRPSASRLTREDLLVSGSSGAGIEIFLLACPTRTGQRIFHTAGLGSMGFAIPASIAVCIEAGRQRTVCVDGDGGFQFNIQELETVARLNLPIKFFVFNNDGYASIRASQVELLRSRQHRLRCAHRLKRARSIQSCRCVWHPERRHSRSAQPRSRFVKRVLDNARAGGG